MSTPTIPRRPRPATRFTLPGNAAATEPPEVRGLARDEVRLMVVRGPAPGRIEHTRFRSLAEHLNPGDLIVVNTSATVAAAISGRRSNAAPVVVHFSGPAGSERWIVELRDEQLHRVSDGEAGERIELPRGVHLTLARGWPDPLLGKGSRLWEAEIAVESGLGAFLEREGRPISYDHIHGERPLRDYQTIFAEQPGSAEMVSASRPFSRRLVAELWKAGVGIAPLLLHTGVSSLEADELPLPERYRVSAETAKRVNAAQAAGGRIVAAGTTVTRALETVANADGSVHAGAGVTELVIGPGRSPRVVRGLITGWHEPEASHLLMLEAVAGRELVARAYEEALDRANGGYLWHEFGDSCLLLPAY
ncbi:MAG TPA: S-adenosylmethionine:tRNA ribosyltransferase-isomerase [Frankiaceae bacterium]|nr:S-adenosylmethionine:tRNA ribosyltransferase-isomerase [Frankiaceae bacterium]